MRSARRLLLTCLVAGAMGLTPRVVAAAPRASNDETKTEPALAYGVGVLLGAGALGLTAFGVYELRRAQDHLETCEAQAMIGAPLTSACRLDPPPLAFVSAGLSWGLAIPLFVGSGLAIARGAKTRGRADARALALALQPQLEFDADARLARAGLTIQFRF